MHLGWNYQPHPDPRQIEHKHKRDLFSFDYLSKELLKE